jgi:hypothetical protein
VKKFLWHCTETKQPNYVSLRTAKLFDSYQVVIPVNDKIIDWHGTLKDNISF